MAVRFPFSLDGTLVHGFDWDRGNATKCRKHGVSQDEIESLFFAPFAVLPDVQHSRDEQRFKAIGRGSRGRGVLVVLTLRLRPDGFYVRPISARFMHRKEVLAYEKEVAGASQRRGG